MSLTRDEAIRRLQTVESEIRRLGVRRLALFGSVLRNEARPDSDVDVLVEFLPGARPTLMSMARMEGELSELIGREVDLRTAGDLSRFFRDEVVTTARLLHAA